MGENDSGRPTLSVIIATWSGTPELADMAYKLCQQVRPMCDEIIVTEDSKEFNANLLDVSDIYILHDNWGDIPNLARSIWVASGDYIATINSDVIITKGNLRDLCVPGKVVSPPCIEYGYYHGFQGPFFVVPKEIIKSHGYLDASKRVGADYDYGYRIRDCFLFSDLLHFSHQGGGKSYSEKRRLLEQKEREEKV